jgi:hypothetical protein
MFNKKTIQNAAKTPSIALLEYVNKSNQNKNSITTNT